MGVSGCCRHHGVLCKKILSKAVITEMGLERKTAEIRLCLLQQVEEISDKYLVMVLCHPCKWFGYKTVPHGMIQVRSNDVFCIHNS